MTNFQADQGGRIRFRFLLIPATAPRLADSIRDALAYARPLAAHVYAGRGDIRHESQTLIQADIAPLVLTRLEPAGSGIAATVLNPESSEAIATIRAGSFVAKKARRTTLAGEALEDIPLQEGEIRLKVGARAWTRIEIED
jgi:hypothetical protein